MSNIIATHLVSSTVILCMHIQARESKGTTRIQAAKPLIELTRSHDRQKLGGGLSGGIDATAHALRVIDIHTVYSAQPIYTLSHAIANSGNLS